MSTLEPVGGTPNRTVDAVESELFRQEDAEVLTGQRAFTGDFEDEDLLHVAIYRSPHAHADIEDVDLSAALELDGVVGGFTGDTLPTFVGPMGTFPFQEEDPFHTGNPRVKFFEHYPLATDRVRFVGEPVAAIAAEDPSTAADAVDRIEAEYAVRPAVVDETDAIEPDAPLLYEAWGDNRQLEFEVSGGDVEGAFEAADRVIEEEIKHHRFTGTPMEPRAVVADYDAGERRLTLHDSTQIPHVLGTLIERTLAVAPLKVEVKAERLGGGFGQKWGFYPEEPLLAAMSIEFERPAKWVERRREHMVATSHAREQTHTVRVGVTEDGEILGLEDTILANAGAAYPQGGPATHITTTMYVPGAYRIRNYRCTVYGLATNKTPFGAHRGFGKAEAAYVIERLVDIVAAELELDPIEVRHRNFIQPDAFPYTSVTGNRMDSGDYPRALDTAVDLVGYDEWREIQAERREADDDRLIGIGVGVCVEPSSSTRMGSYNPGYYSVRIRMDTDGQVHVYPEDPDMGTSHEKAIATIASARLGVREDEVYVTQGDTEACPYGSGTYSSRFSVVGTSAVYEACDRLSAKIRGIAAHHWGEPPDDIVLEGGHAQSSRSDRSMSLDEVARHAYQRLHDLPEGMEPGLELTHYFEDPNITFEADERGRVSMFSAYPYTADIAVIEIDRRLGHFTVHDYVSVHDCGTVLNPTIVEGQHRGALAHGVGGALLEELPYDDHGAPLHRSFMDYLVPTAMEIPDVTMAHIETPTPFTPGGHKGAGETGTISPPPVFANAVEDALRHLGVRVREDVPMKPSYIWEQLEAAGSTRAG